MVCDASLDTLDHIIRTRTESDLDFRKDYLGSDEQRGLAMFVELLRRHGLGLVHAPRSVT